MLDRVEIEAPVPKGWRLNILYKNIRHIYFRADLHKKVFNISAPSRISPKALNKVIGSKAPWMSAQASRSVSPLLIPKIVVEGDLLLFKGKCRRVVIQSFEKIRARKSLVCLEGETQILLKTKPNSGPEDAAKALVNWYRECLKTEIGILGVKWERKMDVRAGEFRVRQMRTRWGSCNPKAKRVWINLALICLSKELLEYVVVHELAHLIEPGHNPKFYRIMDRFLPQWPDLRKTLSAFGPGLG
jgi:predicted metal-dependent hydrolase